jgi:hypothetical protein
MYGRQIAVLVRGSAVCCPADYQNTVIVDQRTGKNSGPALVDYRNGASAILLFSFLGIFLKIVQREEIIKYWGADTDTAE